MASLRAFRETWLSSGDLAWSEWDARRFRYELLWSYYASDTYREQIHPWAHLVKSQRALYRYIRNIYNPMYRLAEFGSTHIWGGMLDPQAGDGEAVASALPIVTPVTMQAENEQRLRAAIAELWKWSNWQTQKDIVTLQGTVKGDVGLRIADDVERSRVYIEVIPPNIIKAVTLDPFNNVKAYVLEEKIIDEDGNTITRREEVERGEGDEVIFSTYRDGKLYGFDGQDAVDRKAWGFVPLVMIQHNNVGGDWGWGEGQPQLSRLMELDDQASLLSDQIRKMVRVPWLVTGVRANEKIDVLATQDGTVGSDGRKRMQAGREDVPMLSVGNAEARLQAMIADLKIEEVSTRTLTILEALEDDYPELTFEKVRRRGEASGMALRVARQPAETKVRKRRVAYDAALVHAHQMAIAIGGANGYDGYAGFGLESFQQGALDHTIGDRPVFDPDEFELAEIDKLLYDGAVSAGKAGIPLPWHMRRQKVKPVTEEDILELEQSPQAAAIRTAAELGAMGVGGFQGEEEG